MPQDEGALRGSLPKGVFCPYNSARFPHGRRIFVIFINGNEFLITHIPEQKEVFPCEYA